MWLLLHSSITTCLLSFACLQVRRAPCACQWPEHCDSQLAPLAPTRAALKRMALEQQQPTQQQPQAQGQAEQQQAAASREDASAGNGCCTSAPTQQQQQQQQACHAGCSDAPSPGAAPSDGSPAGEGGDRQLAALEAQYVHRVYDAIAPHFASTRFAVWPKVRAFLEGLPRGALVADVGCGNGKYFAVRRDGFVLGSDRSAGERAAALDGRNGVGRASCNSWIHCAVTASNALIPTSPHPVLTAPACRLG